MMQPTGRQKKGFDTARREGKQFIIAGFPYVAIRASQDKTERETMITHVVGQELNRRDPKDP